VEGQLSQAPVAMNVARDSEKMKLPVTRSTYMVILTLTLVTDAGRRHDAGGTLWWTICYVSYVMNIELTKINGKTYWICLLRPVADQFYTYVSQECRPEIAV